VLAMKPPHAFMRVSESTACSTCANPAASPSASTDFLRNKRGRYRNKRGRYPYSSIVRRYRWQAAFYGAGFFVLGTAAVWLFNVRFS